MDGVLRGYDLWLNDQYVGFWEQCYNTCLWDLIPFIKNGGKQQLAMRIYSRYKGHEFDNWDDWTPMGIFRDVTLFCVPETHVGSFKVETLEVQDSGFKVQRLPPRCVSRLT
jgi:beta-galactosidase/beta-glucuronidase